MKENKLLGALSDIDEKFIEEAAPKYKKSSPIKTRLVLIAAVIATLTLSFGLWLFVPYRIVPENIREYANSEYYDVIARINSLKTNTPVFKNNFDKYTYALFGGLNSSGNSNTNGFDEINIPTDDKGDLVFKPGSAGSSNNANDGDDQYHETTDNQVSGVTEADLFKRSDKYIFYLNDRILRVYSIAGEESKLVNTFEIVPENNHYTFIQSYEMFLSEDCKTLTVITPGYDKFTKSSNTTLLSIDVSSPETEISVKNRMTVTGIYISSRLADGDILLVTRFMPRGKIDFSDESLYLPRIDTGDGYKPVSADRIVCPDRIDNANYTTVCRINENTLELKDNISLLSFAQDIYVSKSNIFVFRRFEKVEKTFSYESSKDFSEIARIEYSDGKLAYCGSVMLEGYIKDQYSLDEFDGILRIVTTTSKFSFRIDHEKAELYSIGLKTSANLYCVNIKNMKTVSSVIGFAPDGETVRSVRFDGTNAYVCTAVMQTDPVFFFDLSNIRHITYKETGTIEGYSDSLIDLGDGYLLGIGYGSSIVNLKIEIYKESENGVVSVCKYERMNAYFSPLYKAYYVNREENLIGLGIGERYTNESSRYVLLHFDGAKLCELLSVALGGDNGFMRAVLIDGYFYMLGSNDFKVSKIS